MIDVTTERLRFMQEISEFLESGMTLRECLQVMSQVSESNAKSSCCGRAAREIETHLENGSTFSNALANCSAIKFDRTTISFVSSAEQTGKLRETVAFLKKRAEHKRETKIRFTNALLYPLFIVFLSLAGAVAFTVFANDISQFAYLDLTVDYQELALAGVARASFFLMAVIVFCGLLFSRIAYYETEFDVFSALDFLVASHVHIVGALSSALVIAGVYSGLGKKLLTAQSRLSSGLSPSDCFAGLFVEPIEHSLRVSCQAGKEQNMFAAAVSYISQRNELWWKRVLAMVEPFFIVVAGICLLIIISSTVLPLISGIGVGF